MTEFWEIKRKRGPSFSYDDREKMKDERKEVRDKR